MVAIALGTLVVTAAVTAGARPPDRHRRRPQHASPTTPPSSPTSSTGSSRSLPAAAHRRQHRLPGRRQIRRIRALVQTTLSVSDGAVVAIDADGTVREFLGGLLGVDESASRRCRTA